MSESSAIPGARPSLRRVYDLLFAVSFLLCLGQLALLISRRVPAVGVVPPSVICLGILMCWLLLRRRSWDRRRDPIVVSVMLLAAVLPCWLNGAAWPMFLFALVIFVPSWGWRIGATMVGLFGLIQFGVFVVFGQQIADAAVESGASVLVFGAGLVTAWLVADHDQKRREISELLVERERDFVADTELVLAAERNRAARALHDGLGHRLTLTAISLRYAMEARTARPDAAWEQVGQAQRQTTEALQEMRRWVRALTPLPAQDGDADVPQSFEQLAESFRGTGLDVRVTVFGDETAIHRDQRLYLRRFVQEGLTNTLRHAAATTVVIELIIDDTVRIKVGDTGGVATGEIVEGFGLRSLRERAEQFGGSFAHHAWPDGFAIDAELPLRTGSRVGRREHLMPTGAR